MENKSLTGGGFRSGSFREIFTEFVEQVPDRVILSDALHPEGLSWREVDTITARISAGLKRLGIGRDDFVMVSMPRGIEVYCACLGIIRAGGAYVIADDTAPAARRDYIYSDCGCRMLIDRSLYEELLAEEPDYSFCERDAHSAAFAVYTSGSTGNPKGLIHEYGLLPSIAPSVGLGSFNPETEGPFKFLLLAPLMTTAATMIMLFPLIEGSVIIAPEDAVKNPEVLMDFIKKFDITHIFVTPSMLNLLLENSPDRRKSPFPKCVRVIFVSSEPARDIYFEDAEIVNLYCLSETAMCAASFTIDRPYELTPVGKVRPEISGFRLVDEELCDVPDGDSGEIMIKLDYCRGYIGLDEMNAERFRNGWMLTGDMARRLESGDLLITGRKDNMLKINGNRVEPAEIEGAFKTLSGKTRALVIPKGDYGQLCLYYTGSLLQNTAEIREKMLLKLPEYMIPSYFVRIDEFPLLSSGKPDLMALPDPTAASAVMLQDGLSDDPEGLLTGVFRTILANPDLGPDSDFFDNGGNSILAMMAVTGCTELRLEYSDIATGRTPRGIASVIRSRTANTDPGLPDRELHRCLPMQEYFHHYMVKYPDVNELNMGVCRELPAGTDIDRFAGAFERVLRKHPALLTRLVMIDDVSWQQYCPELFTGVERGNMTRAEFDELEEYMMRPFLPEGPLIRAGVYVVDGKPLFILTVSHSAIDALSFCHLMRSINCCYYDIDEPEDRYFGIIREHEKILASDEAQKMRQEAESFYRSHGLYEFSLNASGRTEDPENPVEHALAMRTVKTEMRVSDTAEYAAAIAAAVVTASARFNGSDSAAAIVSKACRDYEGSARSVGCFASEIPVCLDISGKSPAELKAEVKEQLEAHSRPGSLVWQASDSCGVYVPIQPDSFEMDFLGERVNFFDSLIYGTVESPGTEELEIEPYIDNGFVSVLLTYSSSLYTETDIDKFTKLLLQAL